MMKKNQCVVKKYYAKVITFQEHGDFGILTLLYKCEIKSSEKISIKHHHNWDANLELSIWINFYKDTIPTIQRNHNLRTGNFYHQDHELATQGRQRMFQTLRLAL